MSEAAKELVRQFYREAIVERDAGACDRLLAEGFVHNGEARGRAGQRAAVEYFLAAFPDLSHTTNRVVPCPPSAVAITSSHRPSVLGAAG